MDKNTDRITSPCATNSMPLGNAFLIAALDNEERFGFNASLLYLGHSPEGQAKRSYIRPSQEKFDAAIAWLGEEFSTE